MSRGTALAALGAALALLAAAPASASGPTRSPNRGFDPFAVPVPSVPPRDVVFARTSAVAARESASSSARRYPVHDGKGRSVTIGVSASCTPVHCDAANPQRIANFLGTVPHGGEMDLLRVELVTDGQMETTCGRGALACYFAGRNQMYLSGNDDTNPGDGATRNFVLAHEYGHHLADHRRNPPFRPTIDWGTKRWSSFERVCQGVRAGAYFPGDEGTHYYRNPGEAFAEAFALNRFPGQVRWQWVDSLRPSRGAFAALRRDATRPWKHRARLLEAGSLGGASGQRKVVRIPTPLDGVLSLGLKAPAGADFDLALRDRAGRILGLARRSGRREGLNFTICGQAKVRAVVSRVSGGGPFRLTVRRPLQAPLRAHRAGALLSGAIRVSSSPRVGELTTTRSPSPSQTRGSRAPPTPAGVPVATMSPGSSVIRVERWASSSGTEKIRSAVVADCISSPFKVSEIPIASGGPASSGVTIAGPQGAEPSKTFPAIHCGVENCRSRAERSLKRV